MGSMMSLSCSKRKATSQDVESESRKRRKICSTNDNENCRWSLCANRVVKVAAAAFTKFRFQQDNKDTKSSALALPPPPTSVSRIWKHHVFPSFHGADVRTTILSHILESFRRKGIDPFIDNNIERSKSIGPELKEAIRGSKIAIVLLSKNYASSSWCLDELAEIMKCREVLGQIVMTIFYEVDPTDIKKQTGDFGKAFKKTCKGKTKEHTQRWRKALENVATIAGEHSRNWRNEAAMIEKIATDVSNMLNSSTPSRDFDGLVGMRAHMDRMEQLLRLDLDEVRMIGIWGPPGIGKTTIARSLLNQVSDRFQLSAIMVNIKGCYPRPCFDEYTAQLQLQTQMLSQMINHKDIMISHLGVAQERLRDKKVILVLDEVDQLGQLDALAKEIQWFGPGSRIIITTEDLGVLKAHGINHIYKVNIPSSDEAFQIFCIHAFRQKHPTVGFYELARKVSHLAGELPLGLKVLGSALRGMSKEEWKRTLPRLRTRLDGETNSILKFSYDSLSDEDKYLFLYIAWYLSHTFSMGSRLFEFPTIHKVEEVLANKFMDVRQGLHVLAEKSLISITNERIEMHTLLVNFGRETSRKQFVHGIEKRQLMVGEGDIWELLSDDSIDNRRLIGIKLDLSKTNEELSISENALERMSNLQFVRIIGNLERLESLFYYSQKIKSLHWMQFKNICLPSTFNPEFLVELNMNLNNLHKLWEGTKQLKNLRWMNLSHSVYLKELPDLSTATNLEELCVGYCSRLVELPPSIGKLTNLRSLYLRGCSSLVELPFSIGKLISLQRLDLGGCSSLVELPFSIGKLISLQIFNLSGCSSLVKIPSSIENATNLQKLDLSNCSNLVEFPSIGNATKLEQLDLSNCFSLVKLPSTINATNLQRLILTNCSRVVELSNFSSLLEVEPYIGTTNLVVLDISGCTSLVKVPSSIGDIINLGRLDLSNCSSLVKLPSSIGSLQLLYELRMRGCSKLEDLPTKINLISLRTLDLTDCSQLKSFPEISNNIVDFKLLGTGIKEVPLSIMSWSRPLKFRMSYFESLKEFPHAFNIITELVLVREDIQEVPPWIKGMSRLRRLRLYNCNNLISLPQLSDSISRIDANNCKSLERLDCSFNNPKICLHFANCFKLNQEARDLIMHTSTSRYAILPGTQVPAFFNHRATAEGSLKIKLTESPFSTILRFKACIVLVKVNEEMSSDQRSMRVEIDIKDEQKDLKVLRTPRGFTIDQLLTEHIYMFELEVEEVTSMDLVFEFKTYNRKWKIGECGLLRILEVPSC